jgi:hypothetical protein
MTIGDILDFARFQLDDSEEPYKWSNQELCLYFNDAEAEACRRSHLLRAYPSVVSITGINNISFNATTKTISKTDGGFLSAGSTSELETFEADDQITISNTTSNNGIKTISSVTDTSITVVESLVDENNTSATIEATRTVTRIPITAGIHTYRTHPKLIYIIRSRLDSCDYPLFKKSLPDLDSGVLTGIVMDDDIISQLGLGYVVDWESATGTPVAYLEDTGRLRLVTTPTEDDILWMYVSRLPKHNITIKDLNKSPEIPEQYHMGLVDWILHLAYSKADVVTSDSTKAKDFEASFELRFGKRTSAKQEMNRRLYPRNSIMRPQEFGF